MFISENNSFEVPMQENETNGKDIESTGFYSFQGGKNGEQGDNAAQAVEEDKTAHDGQRELSPEDKAAYQNLVNETDRDSTAQSRKKFKMGAVGALLFAVLLCGVGLLSSKLGITASENLTIGKTKLSASSTPAKAKDASAYLKKQSWEKKTHESIKSLTKMKNLRYALEFFESYSPQEIAAIPSLQSGIDNVVANYDSLVGSMLSIQAVVTQKYPVSENIELNSDAPSTLVAVSGSQQSATVSILVIGSSLDTIKAGDKIKFVCLPVYSYSPKDTTDQAGIFFITIPELVSKVS
jgi:hypothetical protein